MPSSTSMIDRISNIHGFVLDNVVDHPTDIVRLTANEFHISRQSAANHVRSLVETGLLKATGKTRARVYRLKTIVNHSFPLDLGEEVEEDLEWRQKIVPLLGDVPENVRDICNYGFTEMVNNVADHSECQNARVSLKRDARHITMVVFDDGVGIFQKLQAAFGLEDPRHALLELSKGKLTSDPANHTGEGVFFTSRMFDEFTIISGTLFFSRSNASDDEWLIEVREHQPLSGTLIQMEIAATASQTMNGVFEKFSDDNFGFSRTHVPIQLAVYEGEKLLSRSQARRILARFERFKEVLLDFRNVGEIGQAFADEIFRIFRREHPDVDIRWVFTTPEIDRMIGRVAPDLVSRLPPSWRSSG